MVGFVALLGAYVTTGAFQASLNEKEFLLEDSRTNEWQTCYDGFGIVNYGFKLDYSSFF